MEDLTGKQLGPYQVVAPLGEGGMAAVYKAFQPGMERYVALKILPRHFASDPEFVGRFEQEAKVLANLRHTNILPVFDFGQADGYTYLVMPYLESGDLTDLMHGEPLPLERIRRIISQVGDALDYAHSRGLVHRDVKPSNVLLDERGNCLLSDFGITKIVEGTAHFTATGGFVGTPAYMSPEQGLGKRLDGRSDIYALGILLYEMVTGRVPYRAETPMAVVVKHINDPLSPPRQVNPNLPEAVEQIILKSLAKQPEDRYATAGEMVRALQAAIPETILEDTLSSDEAATLLSSTGATLETQDQKAVETAVERKPFPPKWGWGLAAVAVVIVVIGAIAFFATGGGSDVDVEGTTPETAAEQVAEPVEVAPETLTTVTSEVIEPETTAVSTLDPALYDDFDNPAYDGAFNTSKWLAGFPESCHVAQQDGVLVIENRASPNGIGCNLEIGRPTYVPFGGLGVMEARLKISGDHNGKPMNHGLTIATTDESESALWAICGLYADEDGVRALIDVDVNNAGQPEIHEDFVAEYDRWYTFRLETDPDSKAISCLVDDKLIGSIIPSNALELEESRFQRLLADWRLPGSVAAISVDNVRLIGRVAQTTAASTPAATADVDPTVYDDFNNPAFDGSFNQAQWDSFDPSGKSQIAQNNGLLTIVRGGQPQSAIGLVALQYYRKPIQVPTFFEATLMVEESQDGHAYLFLGSNLPSEDYTDCTLGYGDEQAIIQCGYFHKEESLFWTEEQYVDYGTWHSVRVEIDPEPMAFAYYIDGQEAGSYVPPNPEELKEAAKFQFDIGVWGASTAEVTGYFDEVRIGKIEQ